jgi:predicted nucleic-acid-binding Zn-ribbon protein
MKDSLCPKCQSSEVIPNVEIIDHAHLNQPMALSATVYTNPEAWVFKGAIMKPFRARVCGGCGYTEFYVDDPQGLTAWAKRAAPNA